MSRSTSAQRVIPLAASLTVDSQRLAAMGPMSLKDRSAAAHRGELSLRETCGWSARRPSQVEFVDGEFFFLAALEPEFAEASDADR